MVERMRFKPTARFHKTEPEVVDNIPARPARVMPSMRHSRQHKSGSRVLRSPTKMKFLKGKANEDNRDAVAKQRKKENAARAKRQLDMRLATAEPKLMPRDIDVLESKGVRELRKLAKDLGIKGASRMTKNDIVMRLSTVSAP